MSSVVLMSLDTARVGAWSYVTDVPQLVTVTGYFAPAASADGVVDADGLLEAHPASKPTAASAAQVAMMRDGTIVLPKRAQKGTVAATGSGAAGYGAGSDAAFRCPDA